MKKLCFPNLKIQVKRCLSGILAVAVVVCTSGIEGTLALSNTRQNRDNLQAVSFFDAEGERIENGAQLPPMQEFNLQIPVKTVLQRGEDGAFYGEVSLSLPKELNVIDGEVTFENGEAELSYMDNNTVKLNLVQNAVEEDALPPTVDDDEGEAEKPHTLIPLGPSSLLGNTTPSGHSSLPDNTSPPGQSSIKPQEPQEQPATATLLLRCAWSDEAVTAGSVEFNLGGEAWLFTFAPNLLRLPVASEDFWKYVTAVELTDADGADFSTTEADPTELSAASTARLTCEFAIPANMVDAGGKTSFTLEFTKPLKAINPPVALNGSNYSGSVVPKTDGTGAIVTIKRTTEEGINGDLSGEFTMLCGWDTPDTTDDTTIITIPAQTPTSYYLCFLKQVEGKNLISVTLVDGDGNPITAKPAFDVKVLDEELGDKLKGKIGAPIWLQFEFTFGADAAAGAEFTVDLPDGLLLSEADLQIPISEGATIITTVTGNKERNQLNFYYTGDDDKPDGTFRTPVYFTTTQNTGAETLKLTVAAGTPTATTTYMLPLNYKPFSSDPRFKKEIKKVDGSDGYYDVTVSVLPGNSYQGTPLQYSDVFENLVPATMDEHGNAVATFGKITAESPTTCGWDADNKKITYAFDLGKLDGGAWHTLTYRMKVASDVFTSGLTEVPLKSTAGSITGIDISGAGKSFTIAGDSAWTASYKPVLMGLQYEMVSGHKDMLKWTLTIDGSKITMPDAQLTLSYMNDDKGMQYLAILNEGTWITTINNGSIEPTINEHGLTAGLGTIDSLRTVTFYTRISEAFFEENYPAYLFKIKAKVEWDKNDDGIYKYGSEFGEGELGQPITNNVVKKTLASYNAQTGVATWQIDVNENEKELTNVVLTDTLKGELGTDKVYTKSGDTKTSLAHTYVGKLVTINLGEVVNSKMTLFIDEQLPDEQGYFNFKDVDGKGQTFTPENSITITADTGFTSPVTVAAPAKECKNELLDKSAKEYNRGDRTIHWTITINKEKAAIGSNVELTDTIFLSGDLEQKLKANADETTYSVMVNDVSTPVTRTVTDGNDTFTLTIPGVTGNIVTVEYDTVITGSLFYGNSEHLAQNSANISFTGRDGGNMSITRDATAPVHPTVITKVADTKNKAFYVKYTVTVNEDFSSIAGATIEDEITFTNDGGTSPLTIDGTGMVLNAIDKAEDEKTINIDAFINESGVAGSGHAKLVMNPTGKSFKLYLPDSSDKYELTYNAKVVDRTDTEFTVNNKAQFKDKTQTTAIEAPCSTDIKYSTGSMTGMNPSTSGKIRIQNKDVNTDTDTTLGNIEGTVYGLYDKIGVLVATKTTGKDGIVTFEGLTDKQEYTLKEITPGNGFLPTTTNNIKIIAKQNPANEVTTSKAATTTISFIKLFETLAEGDVAGNPVAKAGAEFTLTDGKRTYTANSKAIVDADGNNVTFMDVTIGNYRLAETPAQTTPLTDYKAMTPVDGITVTQDKRGETPPVYTSLAVGNMPVSVTNLLKNYTITVNLTGTLLGTPPTGSPTVPSALLKGAEFTLTGTGLTDGIKVAVDDKGNLIFKSDKIKHGGTYTVTQTTATPNFNFGKITEIKLEPITGDKVVEFENVYQGGVVTVIKKEAVTEKPLSGATFKLLPKDGADATAKKITNADGKAYFLVPNGTYTVSESAVLDGYTDAMDIKPTVTVAVTADNVEHPVAIDYYNVLATAEVPTFTKVNENGAVVQGAVFTLYKHGETGETVELQTATSGSDGKVQFAAPVGLGDYTIKETVAPVGYQTPKQVLTLTVEQEATTPWAAVAVLGIKEGDDISGIPNNNYRFVNELKTYTITVNLTGKLDGEVHDDYPTVQQEWLEGAKFTLTGTGLTDGIEAAVDKYGMLIFDSDKIKHGGTYTIKQTTPASGFLPSAEFVVNGIKENTIANLVNVYDGGVVTVIKMEKVEGNLDKPMLGATFELRQNNAMVSAKAVTKVAEKTYFLVPSGTYTVSESAMLKGFTDAMATKPIVTVSAGMHPVCTYYNVVATVAVPTFTKVNESNAVVQGAVFTLYKQGETVGLQTATSGSDGKMQFAAPVGLGDYTIKETVAPVGYPISNQVLTLSVTQNTTTAPWAAEAVLKTEEGKDISKSNYKFKNIVYKNDIVVKLSGIKYDNAPAGRTVAGSDFTLTLNENTAVSYTAKIVSTGDDTGVLTFKNVHFGTYTLAQTTTVGDYVEVTPDQTVTINSDASTQTFDFINKLPVGRLTVEVTSDGTSPIAGATLKLTGQGGDIVTPAENPNGTFTWENVPFGSYTLTQTAPPDGHAFDTLKSWAVMVDADNWQVKQDIKNPPIAVTVEIKKVISGSAKTPLAGAKFELWKNGEAVSTEQTTDASGIARFDNVGVGIYTIRETAQPAGYQVPATSQTFEVTKDMTTQNMVVGPTEPIVNTKRTGTSKFRMRLPIVAGVVFSYTPTDDPENPIQAASDKDGYVIFPDTAWGSGTLVIVSAPVGYKFDPTPIEVSEVQNPPFTEDSTENTPDSDFGITQIPQDDDDDRPSPPKNEFPKQPGQVLTPQEQKLKETLTVEGEKVKTLPDLPIAGTVAMPTGAQVKLDTPAANGVVTLMPDGSWNYTPNAGFTGEDTFLLRVDMSGGKVEFRRMTVWVQSDIWVLPQTGGVINTVSLLSTGVALIIVGVAYEIRSKKKRR